MPVCFYEILQWGKHLKFALLQATDVNSAMEASTKSQNAFAAANVNLEDAQDKEGIVSVKRVLDFSFQNVEELVYLVRLAFKAVNRQGFNGNRE